MKKLKDLLNGVEVVDVVGEGNIRLGGISSDTRKLEKGYIYVAVKGLTVDGHGLINEAIRKGAKVIVGEVDPDKKLLKGVSYVKVKDSRGALGLIASNQFDNPSREMHVIGVTGTDGKTTTASMIYHILEKAGKRVGLLTTVSAKVGDEELDTGYHVTSPEPVELHRLLSKMVDNNLNYAVIEVTSHGLSQGRVVGVDFETAVMTNITHEHLDYHKSKKDYFNAKLKLFLMAKNYVILNNDDPKAISISRVVGKGVDIITYAIKKRGEIVGSAYLREGKYFTFDAKYKNQKQKVKLKIPGKFNMENALAAISTGIAYGTSLKDASYYLRSFNGVKGRMHEIKNNKGMRIYVDFAHTPNSLKRVLKYLKKNKRGKFIVIFGCAGERDIEKRDLMPKISIKYADISIFTAEDPRNENLEDILKQMNKSANKVGGKHVDRSYYVGNKNVTEKNIYLNIPERGEAISYAINEIAQSGDTVAILGKGHEKSMAYNGIEYPWSDFDAVKLALADRVKKIKRK